MPERIAVYSATTTSSPTNQRCSELESGGRMIDAILTNTVLPRISREYLTRLAQGQELRAIALSVQDSEFQYTFE